MIIPAIVCLIATIVILTIYNITLGKKLSIYVTMNQKILNLNLVQEFMQVLSEDIDSDKKIKRLNELIIEKYQVRYSSIIVFNGTEYEIKATNIIDANVGELTKLHLEKEFNESVSTSEIKYLTSPVKGAALGYPTAAFRGIKEAMFLPLYIDNIYIGYWILEDDRVNALKGLDKELVDVIKNNIVSALKATEYQSIIENLDNIDQSTGLRSKGYLFGDGKIILNKFPISTICMLVLKNIDAINEKNGRKIGDYVFKEITNKINSRLGENVVFVRFTGPKFVIAFPGNQISDVNSILNEILKDVNSKVILEDNAEVSIKVNIAVTTYYKGTRLYGVIRKLEKYVDLTTGKSNQVNII